MGSTRSTHTLEAIADSLMAFALIVAATIWAHQNGMPLGSVAKFLHFRLTLLNASFSIVFAVLWRQCFSALDSFRGRGLLRPWIQKIAGCAIMTAIVALYLEARHAEGPVAHILAYFFMASLAYETIRLLGRALFDAGRGQEPENVIILGSGRRASKAWRELRVEQHRNKRLLGFVDDRDPGCMPPDIAQRYLGRVDNLAEYLLRNEVDEVVIAAPLKSGYAMIQRAINIAEAAGIRVVCLSDFFTLAQDKSPRPRAHLFVELLAKDEGHLLAQRFKRVVDFAGASLGLVLLSPVFLFVAAAVKATTPGPVFVSVARYGFRRRPFRMWKFRSVTHEPAVWTPSPAEKHEAMFRIKSNARLTALGRFLRRTSIEELPQLWNVVRGEMSLVGPRPMSVRDVSLFDELSLTRRFSVRPGITGIWQVAHRSSLSFEQWATLDSDYIDEWSLGLDLKILARTLPAVVKRSGAA